MLRLEKESHRDVACHPIILPELRTFNDEKLKLEILRLEGWLLMVKFADDAAIIAKIQKELQDMVNRLVNTGRKYGMEINIHITNKDIQEKWIIAD